MLSVNMGKQNQPEEDCDWVLLDRESSPEQHNSLESEVASISSSNERWSIGGNGGSEFDGTEEVALTMPNKACNLGIDRVSSRQTQQTTTASCDMNTSASPEQIRPSPNISQSRYVLGNRPSPTANNNIPTQIDPQMAIPRTSNTVTAPDLPQLFPHLSKRRIEEWMKKDPCPHEMAFIGAGAYVSSARNYTDFLEEFSPRVTTHQQNANPAATTEQNLGKTVNPEDPTPSNDESISRQ